MPHLRVLASLLALALLTSTGAQGAPRRTRTKARAPAASSTSSTSSATSTTSAASTAPAESPEPQRVSEPRSSSSAAAAPAPHEVKSRSELAPAARSAPAQAEAPAARPPPRLGLGLDLFGESGHMSGGQWINASHREESFDYSSSKFVSASAWLLFAKSDRLRWGPGVRVFGNYAAGGDRPFGFGVLTEALALGEYGIPVYERFEAVVGVRGGLAMLLPGGGLSDEISRLRTEGAGVWNVPRFGWVLGLSAGARRQMTQRIALRADMGLQMERLYLFATDQEVEGLHFQKNWTTKALRLGLTLGAEFSL